MASDAVRLSCANKVSEAGASRWVRVVPIPGGTILLKDLGREKNYTKANGDRAKLTGIFKTKQGAVKKFWTRGREAVVT